MDSLVMGVSATFTAVGGSISNVRIWFGTSDDWLGTTDQPDKYVGNVDSTGTFTELAEGNTVKVNSGTEAVVYRFDRPERPRRPCTLLQI